MFSCFWVPHWLLLFTDKYFAYLTHWGRVTHICVGKLTIIDSDNGLSPGRRQAIIWTNAGILIIEPSGTNFDEILIGIHMFSFKKMHLKMSSGKWRPCSGLNNSIGPIARNCPNWPSGNHICGPKLPAKLLFWKFGQQTFSCVKQLLTAHPMLHYWSLKYWTLIWIINEIMQMRLQYLEWLSIDTVQDSGLTGPVEMDIVYDYRISIV